MQLFNESFDTLRLTATIIVVCLIVSAVLYFYLPIRDATTTHLDGIVDMQRKEVMCTVDFIDGQLISGAEAKQFCIRYQNSNIARVPAPGSIVDLSGQYSVSVNYSTEPVTITFTPVAGSSLY